MKFNKLFLAGLFLGSLLVVSCSKDDDKDIKPGDEYSSLTVEQNKAKVEDEGIEMLGTIKEFEKIPTIDAAKNMLDYAALGNLFENNPNVDTDVKSSQLKAFFKPVIIASNQMDFNAKRMANSLSVNFEDEESLLSLWNTYKGTYTFNSTKKTWSYAAGSEIKIVFPSTQNGTANNVTFRVYDFQYEVGPFSWTPGYAGELPKQIKSELKVDNNVVLSYALEISYSDKMPNKVKATLEMAPFQFASEVSNSGNVDAAVSFSWKKNATTLLMMSMDATGNWTERNLNGDDLTPGDVIKNGNVTFQIMNLKIAGKVDVLAIDNAVNALPKTLTEEQQIKEECAIINKYASLYLCYADNNQTIAKIIAYPVQETDTYYDWYEQREVTEIYWEVGMRFKFKDESTVDMETYFEKGFDDLLKQVKDYMTYLQTKY